MRLFARSLSGPDEYRCAVPVKRKRANRCIVGTIVSFGFAPLNKSFNYKKNNVDNNISRNFFNSRTQKFIDEHPQLLRNKRWITAAFKIYISIESLIVLVSVGKKLRMKFVIRLKSI